MAADVKVVDINGSLHRWTSETATWEIPRVARETFYAKLESLLAETQAYTHVETGSLRASGKIHTSYDMTRAVLSGEITYGGSAPGGVHDPVRYAVYEAARGPEHNPLTPIYAAAPQLELLFSRGDLVIAGRIT